MHQQSAEHALNQVTGRVFPLSVVIAGATSLATLCLILLRVPGYVKPEPWAQAIIIGTVIYVIGLSFLFWYQRPSATVMFWLSIVIDLAAGLFSIAVEAPQAMAADLLYLGIPTAAIAFYCSRARLLVHLGLLTLIFGLSYYFQSGNLTIAAFATVSSILAITMPALAFVSLRGQLASAVLAAEQQSNTDPLTGLANRRGLAAGVEDLVAAAHMQGHFIAVAVLDIDHFKRINDRYGHAQGDYILKQIAALLRTTIRDDDILARLGGEEFAVLAAMPKPRIAEFGERLRADVAHTFRNEGPTVSVGVVAAYAPQDLQDAEGAIWSLIDEADELMYSAKENGRNRVFTKLPESGEIILTAGD